MDKKELQKKNAIDFLLSSYFGIKIKSSMDDIFDNAIDKAFIDATLRGAFSIKKTKKELTDAEKEEISRITKKIRVAGNKLIRKSVCAFCGIDDVGKEVSEKEEELLIKNMPDDFTDFDSFHEKLCNGLVALCKDLINNEESSLVDKNEQHFHIGNAQKWVNMTMKNLYVICGISEISEVHKPIKMNKSFSDIIFDISGKFHIPIDNKILKIFSEGKPEIVTKQAEWVHKCGKDYVQYYIKHNENVLNGKEKTPWSKIKTYELYKKVKEEMEMTIVKKGLSPIEWECKNW